MVDLRRHAAAALPDYMVPNVVAFVDGFPATANGKLDRDGLPWPVEPGSSHRLSPSPTEAAPAGTDPASGTGSMELAGEIGAIFADVLGLAAVDPDADVWDLGATSFTMVQVSGVLLQRYGRRVPVSAMLADPSPAGVARAVGGDARPEPVDAPPDPVEARPDPVEFFSTGVRRFLDAVIGRPATWRLILLPLEGTPEIVRDHVEQNRERILRQIERLVRASIEEGQLPAELDAELAARMVRDLGEEAGRMILTDPKHYTPDRYERFVQSVVRLILPR